jgi:hypothetical protein
MQRGHQWRLAAWGVFLFVLGVFLFSHPARIDAMDAQFRVDVSENILNLEGPHLSDYYTVQYGNPRNPKTGVPYSYYGAAASLTPLPFMFVSRVVRSVTLPADRFAFSLAGVFLGALLAPLLLAFYRRLGVRLSLALGCTLTFCLATLWWPGSVTTFDQNQQGLFLFGAVFAAWQAARSRCLWLALLSGLLLGALLSFKVPYAMFFPFACLAFFAAPDEDRPGKARPWALIAVCTVGFLVGVAGLLGYNWMRFGQVSMPSYYSNQTTWGNPLVGFLTLAVSPGKGIFRFSPPLILAFFGIRALWAKSRPLTLAIAGCTVFFISMVSSLAFAGGDYCWGPRYALVLMPLWALFLPFAAAAPIARRLAPWIVGLGVVVSVLGVSIDHNRFFANNRFEGYFYQQDPWVYFKKSQLLQRPSEVWESFVERNQHRPVFDPSPTKDPTRALFGAEYILDTKEPMPPIELLFKNAKEFYTRVEARRKRGKILKPDTRLWQEKFQVFYLPRPWWGWIQHVPAEKRPVEYLPMALATLLATLAGGLLLAAAVRDPERPDTNELLPSEEPLEEDLCIEELAPI